MCVCMVKLWMHIDTTPLEKVVLVFTLAEMHGCAFLPCLCSHGTSQCDSCKIDACWVFVLFCFLLISESREPKQAEWVRLVFYGSFLPLVSVFLVSFSFCLSLRLSALALHLISAPSHPSPYKQPWYFFLCVSMHVHVCAVVCAFV